MIQSIVKNSIYSVCFCIISFYLLFCPSVIIAHQCVQPNVFYNGTQIKHHTNIQLAQTYVFKVDVGGGARVQYCKLVCQQGAWKGPYCSHDPSHDITFTPGDVYKAGCRLDPATRPDLEIRAGHHVLTGRHVTRDHDDVVLVRCSDQTRSMSGHHTLRCRDGAWSAPLPQCVATYQEFSALAPPRLQWGVSGSVWGLGRVGQLVVRPGAIIHLDCLQDRRRGNPSWHWSHTHKEYPTGWVVYSSQRNTHYRLSIIYAKLEDSDTFTCVSQHGMTSSLSVTVTSLSCPDLVTNARTNTSVTHIGSVVNLDCPTGSELTGESVLECRDDGTWSSAPTPQCTLVQCPPLEVSSPHLRLLTLNNSFLGTATFSCPLGYALAPPIASIWCDHRGAWSDRVPGCDMVTCPPPAPPMYGSLVSSGDYRVGSTLTVLCSDGFILIGESIIRCTESGNWSHEMPFCKRACRYPGHQDNGDITPIKFSYNVGERLAVICRPGFVISGDRSSVQCLETGHWSSALPACLSWQ